MTIDALKQSDELGDGDSSSGKKTRVDFRLGSHQMSLDDRGRMPIPASLKIRLEERMVGTAWFDGCLLVCNESQWELVIGEAMKKETQGLYAPRDADRLFVGQSFISRVDRQNRILVPNNYLRYADIINKAMVLGFRDRLELWGLNRWQEHLGNLRMRANQVIPGGLPSFVQ